MRVSGFKASGLGVRWRFRVRGFWGSWVSDFYGVYRGSERRIFQSLIMGLGAFAKRPCKRCGRDMRGCLERTRFFGFRGFGFRTCSLVELFAQASKLRIEAGNLNRPYTRTNLQQLDQPDFCFLLDRGGKYSSE